jgi:Ca2+:H+ antiporter
MLLAVPAAIVLRFINAGPLVLFCAAALGIIPLAAALGEATEALAEHAGDRLGGLLNVAMGNITELIIALFMLKAGHLQIVKASLSGSIIGNALLVLGFCALTGGIGREKQTFSRMTAGINSTMLFIAVVGLVMPAMFDIAVYGSLNEHGSAVEQVSVWTSAVLIGIYALSLLFTFVTHAKPTVRQEAEPETTTSVAGALTSLAIGTILVALLSEILVAQVEAVKSKAGFSDIFVGVIVIAIIGNAAEHATAVMMARRDRMDLALTIAIGSSAQIALFVAPVLVFASLLMGHPMSLVFSPLEIAGIALAVLIVEMISYDGETTWFEGAELIAVYLILAVSFFFVPARQ